MSENNDPRPSCSLRIVHELSAVSLAKKLAAQKSLVTSRLLLAVDHSVRSKLIVDSVLSRPWTEGTTVQVLTVVDERSGSDHSRFFVLQRLRKVRK